MQKTKEEQSRNNSAATGQGTGSASRNTHNNIFELFYRTSIPPKLKILTTWWSVHSRQGHSLMASRPPEARSKEYRICTHPDPLSATLSLNHCYKAPHQIPSYPSWDTQFLRIQACCFSFCLESNKVILSMNTSPKTLSLRFNSALVHRGQVFSIIINSQSDTLTQIFIDLATVG